MVTTTYRLWKDGNFTDSKTEHYLKPNRRAPCVGDRCLVRCRKCTKENEKEVACGHSLTCDCRYYMDHSVCKHQHMLSKYAPPSSKSRAGCVGDVGEAGQAAQSDHAYSVVETRSLLSLHNLLTFAQLHACYCYVTVICICNEIAYLILIKACCP